MRLRIFSFVSLLFLGSLTSTSTATEPQASTKLYDQLGGVHKISFMVNDLIDMFVKTQDALAKQKKVDPKMILGPERISLAKYHVSLFVCSLADGPEKFMGPQLTDAVGGLNITEDAFKQLQVAVKLVMDKNKIEAGAQTEVLKRLTSKSSEITRASTRPARVEPIVKGRGTYEEVGGDGQIALVVDSYFKQLEISLTKAKLDAALSASNMTMPGLKLQMIDVVCSALGGPQRPVERQPMRNLKLDRGDDRKPGDVLSSASKWMPGAGVSDARKISDIVSAMRRAL